MFTPISLVPALLIAETALALSWQQPSGVPPYGTLFGLPGQNATYDYVIIGGGTAGLVVATRLAENRDLSIAVVEAGTFYEISNGNNSQVPQYSFASVAGAPEYVNPWIDWELDTTPQPQLNNRSIHYAQGKALGGSSARNQMIYQRGSKGSYDLWAQEVGDEALSWDNMLPFFEKSVHASPPNNAIRAANASVEFNASSYSTSGGPLKVSWPKYAMPFSSHGLPAFHQTGLKMLDDFSSGDLMGAAYNPFTIDPIYQTRSSSETSFLQSAIQQGLPLKVYPMTQALRILFSPSKRATGVQVSSAGRTYTLSARHEVILSAGAFHSPQLLMVSGIGPAETLQQHNISVIANRPGVGQNLHDSCNIGGVTHPVSVISTAILERDPVFAADAIAQFNTNGTGILTNEGGDVLSFQKIPAPYRSNLSPSTQQRLNATWTPDWPELELVLSSTGKSFEGSSGNSQNIVSIGMLMVAALSRGNVSIRSASMLDKPVVNSGWLADEGDVEVAVQAYKLAREVWKHIDCSVGDEVAPGANVTTDEQLRAYVRGAVSPIHHASSTNMMGRANDTMAVVDPKGRVIGVDALRVIDSSSFRFTPPGHTQAATYAHAEMLVDQVKKAYVANVTRY